MSAAAPYDVRATASELAAFFAGSDAGDGYAARKRTAGAASMELAQAWAKVRFAVQDAHAVLDWGCRDGVFAWLARRELGEAAALWGCDILPPEAHGDTHRRIGLQYAPLAHPWQLPYADASFDLVLAGGVLEHVPNEVQSLTELWRVLRHGGRLVITHLPNATSLSEWVARRFWPGHAHARRYRPGQVRDQLLRVGFLPLRWGCHQVLPVAPPDPVARPGLAALLQRVQPFNHALEKLWPLNRLSTTLWIVAEKRLGF